jgi:hypothetical protein
MPGRAVRGRADEAAASGDGEVDLLGHGPTVPWASRGGGWMGCQRRALDRQTVDPGGDPCALEHDVLDQRAAAVVDQVRRGERVDRGEASPRPDETPDINPRDTQAGAATPLPVADEADTSSADTRVATYARTTEPRPTGVAQRLSRKPGGRRLVVAGSQCRRHPDRRWLRNVAMNDVSQPAFLKKPSAPAASCALHTNCRVCATAFRAAAPLPLRDEIAAYFRTAPAQTREDWPEQ